ncbi:MAG: GTPase domain-containing protein [Deltaproteobacteria bacterium]|nr:GTPase domain-containing protein [Deltaproteobacteria bacterium]
MQLNAAQRELALKIVYYGPGLSGKTTNLQAIHKRLDAASRGRLMTLDTADDRTLFFDLLPIYFQSEGGLKVKIKLYTVPGQVMHNSTRRLVLRGADGIAFIADSQRSQSRANNEYWQNMLSNLRENGIEYGKIPIAVQFNKRDLPDIRSSEELGEIAERGREPIFEAIAIQGIGVLETFHGLLRMTWRDLEAKHDLKRKFGLREDEFLRSVFEKLDTTGCDLPPEILGGES